MDDLGRVLFRNTAKNNNTITKHDKCMLDGNASRVHDPIYKLFLSREGVYNITRVYADDTSREGK